MTQFGSPLSAGPAITNPSQRLALVNVQPGANQFLPSATTMYDVSAFTGVFIRTFTNNYGANFTTVGTNFYDVNGSVIGAANKAPAPVILNSNNGNGLLWYVKCLGPQLQLQLDNVPAAAQLDVFVFGTNMVGRYDGPYTPSESGRQLIVNSQTLGAGGAGTTLPLPDYIGPAIMYVRNVTLFTSPSFAMLTNQSGAEIAAVGSSGSMNGLEAVTLWIPPAPCSVTPNNVAGAASVIQTVIIAA